MFSSESLEPKRLVSGKFGKDPTVETSFLPDRCNVFPFPSTYHFPVMHLQTVKGFCMDLELTYELRGAEDAVSVSERQRSKLSVKGCGNSGFVNRNRFEVIIFMGLSYLTWMQWNTFWAKSIFCNDSDEPLEITYSYWDGAGHRRVIQVRLHPTFVIYWRAFNFFLINIGR